MNIHRWLIERNLRSYRQQRHLPITPTHSRARLKWCLTQSGWNHGDWGRTVFSDEFFFQLCPDDNRRRVWRRPGQRADPAFTIARHTGPQQGVIVRGAISFEAGPLWSSLQGHLQAHRYVVGILKTALLPFLLQYPGLIFQQDNAKPHTTHVAMNCFIAYKIIPWPARSLSNQARLGYDGKATASIREY
ncbi:transposable element Tc1 transposase [Trichonephila clavipes]|nr:transposable element Tc1 transposase [Trichonephila clavipes]